MTESRSEAEITSEGMIAVNGNLDSFQQVFADHSWSKFFVRWRAVKHLTQMASAANGAGPQLSPVEARTVIEGLVAGLESVHWGVHRRCKRALETLSHPDLIEAVCDLIIEREIPRLRDIAVTARYEPQDSLRKTAYLFVLGRQQFYEAYDPTGEMLERFYVAASTMPRNHLLHLAQTRATEHWGRWLTTLMQQRGAAVLSEEELPAALEILPKQQGWTALWEIAQTRTLQWSWQATRKLAAANWQPTEAHAASCWAQGQAASQLVADPITVGHVDQQRAVLHGHTDSVQAVAFSPAGTTLASGSWVRTVHLWDVASGQQSAVLHGHTRSVRAVAFSPDGTTLATGSDDHTVRLWNITYTSRFVEISLARMTADDLNLALRLLTVHSLPAEQRAVARYVAAILQYRFEENP